MGGAPPVVEKAFSDDGAFFADDDGAIGFTGSCRAEPRLVDLSARTSDSGEPTVKPVLCVRRGPGEWAERRVDLAPGETLVAWAPRRDGTATAIVQPDVPLPPRVGAPRATEEAGVRVLRLYKEVPDWTLRRSWQADRSGSSSLVDRRFHVRDDGSVDAWLGPADDDTGRVARGVTYDPTGVPDAHPLPPGMVATLTGGAFALAMTGDGHLHESTDHGRTWQPAGLSPVPVVSSGSFACSSLGCDLGSVVRLGWGEDPGLAPRVSTEPPPTAPPVALPRLTCTPRGVPAPNRGTAGAARGGARATCCRPPGACRSRSSTRPRPSRSSPPRATPRRLRPAPLRRRTPPRRSRRAPCPR